MRTARREGDKVILEIDMEDAQALRVALQPCTCRNTKSHSTSEIRAAFVRGIGMAMSRPDAGNQEAL